MFDRRWVRGLCYAPTGMGTTHKVFDIGYAELKSLGTLPEGGLET